MLEKKKAGELEFYGAEDVLTTALESQEHSGKVRAVGGYITPKQYFKLPREKKIRITKEELMARDRQRDEKTEKKMQALEAEIAQLKAMFASSVGPQSPKQPEKASSQPEKESPQLEKANVDDDEECVMYDQPKPTPPAVSV